MRSSHCAGKRKVGEVSSSFIQLIKSQLYWLHSVVHRRALQAEMRIGKAAIVVTTSVLIIARCFFIARVFCAHSGDGA